MVPANVALSRNGTIAGDLTVLLMTAVHLSEALEAPQGAQLPGVRLEDIDHFRRGLQKIQRTIGGCRLPPSSGARRKIRTSLSGCTQRLQDIRKKLRNESSAPARTVRPAHVDGLTVASELRAYLASQLASIDLDLRCNPGWRVVDETTPARPLSWSLTDSKQRGNIDGRYGIQFTDRILNAKCPPLTITTLERFYAICKPCGMEDPMPYAEWNAAAAEEIPGGERIHSMEFLLHFKGTDLQRSLLLSCYFFSNLFLEPQVAIGIIGPSKDQPSLKAWLEGDSKYTMEDALNRALRNLRDPRIDLILAIQYYRFSFKKVLLYAPLLAQFSVQRLRNIANLRAGVVERVPVTDQESPTVQLPKESWRRSLHDIVSFRWMLYHSRDGPLKELHDLFVRGERSPLDILDLLAHLARCHSEWEIHNIIGPSWIFLPHHKFLQLYQECTGNVFSDPRLQSEQHITLITDIDFSLSLRDSLSPSAAAPTTMDCIFLPNPGATLWERWRVLFRVNVAEYHPLSRKLTIAVSRKLSGATGCNCDMGFRHFPHTAQIWSHRRWSTDVLRHLPNYIFEKEAVSCAEISPSTLRHETRGDSRAAGLTVDAQFHFPFRGQTASLQLWRSACVAQGAHGRVYRANMATATSHQCVVVKLFPPSVSDEDFELLDREVRAWSALDSPRILPFYGSVAVGWDQIGLVSPFMMNGTMAQFLYANPSADRHELIKQVAEGMVYLHSVARIVHGDLKCENILISDRKSALIGDFGLSTLMDATNNATATHIRGRNTLRFAAPELLIDAAVTESLLSSPRSKTIYSDVYAFGMLIYQAYTGAPPWTGLNDVQVIVLVSKGAIPARVREGVDHPPLKDGIWAICGLCWRYEAQFRPTATKVFRLLREK